MKFYDIDSIQSVGLNDYTVEITLERAYDWNELTTQIIDTIKYVVGWADDDGVVVEHLLNHVNYSYEPLAETALYIAHLRHEAERYSRMNF